MPRDRILIRDLKVFAYHGVLDKEKENGQEFLIDIEVEADLAPSAAGDDLSGTIDYAGLAESVALVATGERYDLIESLAYRLADHVLGHERALAATVTVKKPNAPLPVEAAWVGVTVSRRKQQGST